MNNNDNQKQFVAYYRVSSKRQKEEGVSLEAQKKLANDYALKNDFRIIKEFEIDESAKKANRLTFQEMVRFVQDNSQVAGIICEKVDRLLRGNLKDRVLIEDLINNDDKEIHFVKESLILSRNSKSAQKLHFDIENALARHFLNNLSDEVKKGYDILVDDNCYPHVPPIGYESMLVDHVAIVDKDRARYIKEAFELAVNEYSEKKMAQILYGDGFRSRKGRRVGKSSISKILHNPFYYGWFKWNGELHAGKHEAIIEKELFDRAQVALNPHKKRGYKHNYKYVGLMKCGECGYSITAEMKKGIIYYRCTKPKGAKFCSQEYLDEELLEPQLDAIVEKVSLEIQKLKILKEVFRASHKDEEEYLLDSLGTLNKRYSDLKEKEGLLLDAYLDKKITEDIYDTKSNEIKQELSVVNTEIGKFKVADRAYVQEIEAFLTFCNQASALYKSSSPELKRELLKFVVSNFILKDKKVEYTLKTPFDIVAKYSQSENWQGRKESNLH